MIALASHGLIISQPDADGGELEHGEVVLGVLFEARGDASEVFDAVALAVERAAEAVALLAVVRLALSGMLGAPASCSIWSPDPVCVIGFVSAPMLIVRKSPI